MASENSLNLAKMAQAVKDKESETAHTEKKEMTENEINNLPNLFIKYCLLKF